MNEKQTLTSPKEDTIVYLAAKGMKPAEIAQAVGLTTGHVQSLLNSERLEFEVKHLRYKLHGKDTQKMFRDALPRAIEATIAVMDDPRSKPALILKSAEMVLDRSLGKPKQTIEHEGSLIKKLFEKLDDTKEVVEMAHEASDQISDWVKANLGEGK